MAQAHSYGIGEIVGSSETSIDDAIRNGVASASKSFQPIRWFEVVETRGHVEEGKVAHFQVTLKIGYSLEG